MTDPVASRRRRSRAFGRANATLAIILIVFALIAVAVIHARQAALERAKPTLSALGRTAFSGRV